MTSVLHDILDPSQLQRASAVPGITLAPPTPQEPQTPHQTPQEPSDDSDSENHPPSESDDEDHQNPSTSHNSSGDNVAFAIKAARTLQLTSDGEKSLLQFSQIPELDAMSAMVFQQGTLIKLNETLGRPMTTTQGSGAGDQLALTSEIKGIIDCRARLIVLSPRLSRYRSEGKGLLTGPGSILIEWLRKSSGINKKYLEGEGVYQELRMRVKSTFRHARSELKCMIRQSVKNNSHITVLLRGLTQNLEKWIKCDMKTPMTLAVRIAFLRGVYLKDSSDKFWQTVDQTLIDIRNTAASGNHISSSDILVKFLDADELKFPAPDGSLSARVALTSIWQSETQSSMDEFVASSQSDS